jgi:predicted outer membrane repeat protein
MKKSTASMFRGFSFFVIWGPIAVLFCLIAIPVLADRFKVSTSPTGTSTTPSDLSANHVHTHIAPVQPSDSTINVNTPTENLGVSGGCSLSGAIRAANTNLPVEGCPAGSVMGVDVITLPVGTYTLNEVALSNQFLGDTGLPGITSDIMIQGAGAATTIIQRDPSPSTPNFRLMVVSNQNGGSIILNDLTLRGGRTAGSGPAANQGGALYTFGRPTTLNRVVFDDNRATTGGAVTTSDQGGVLTVNDCTFTNNQATGSGGAIVSGQMTISHSSFSGNRAFSGGALFYVQGGGANFNIADSTFTNNQAAQTGGIGGAIFFSGAATITRGQFTGNSAGSSGSSGGAVAGSGTLNFIDSVASGNQANSGGGLHLTNCSFNISGSTISNNTASTHFGGGLYLSSGGGGTISASTINANSTGIDGGGIWTQNINLTLTNVTVDGNSCGQYGAGIFYQANGRTLALNSVTITQNHAASQGGGILRFDGSITAKNSIIALNTASVNAPDIYAPTAQTFTSLGYNLIGVKDAATFTNATGDQTGTLATPLNPLLGTLQNNAGTTFTRALLSGSPAIDAASPSAPGSGGNACETTDQRGLTRPRDGNGDGSAICDIGAYELQSPIVLTAQQILELKAWTVGGRTYVYVKPQFPDDSYRVTNWGQLSRTGNDFIVDTSIEKRSGPAILAVVTTAQIYDLGPLADSTYNFNFKTSGTLAKALQFTVSSAAPSPNPIDDARQFVKQQYRDFLNREADQAGEDFWTDNITKCSDPARRPAGQTVEQCTLRQKETTSGAFFLSPEFQYTGYFVYRMYQGALGRQPKLSEFTPDALFVGNGIIVNGQLSGAKINQNKADYAAQFVNCTDVTKYRCSEFKAIYDGLSNQQYVDKLFLTTGVNASASDRTALVNELNANPTTGRATVLQKVVDGINVIAEGNQQFTTTYGQAFYDQQFTRAFVQLEYFGYMKRDPDEAGYAFWLAKLNQFGGNFVNAEMVLAFISSPEYRARFGQP